MTQQGTAHSLLRDLKQSEHCKEDLPPHLAACSAEAGVDMHNMGSRQAPAELPTVQSAVVQMLPSLLTHCWREIDRAQIVKAGLRLRVGNKGSTAAAPSAARAATQLCHDTNSSCAYRGYCVRLSL